MLRIALSLFASLSLALPSYAQQPIDGKRPNGDAEQPGLSRVMIRLIDPLDEPEFYCLDIPGYGPNVQLKSPLTAHTLKAFGSDDQMWVLDYPTKGQIYAPAYKLCIEAQRAEPGAPLLLKEASNSPLQRFKFAKNGTLALSNHPDIGLVVADGEGTPAKGPSHVVRKLALGELPDASDSLKRWKIVDDADSWPN